MCMDPTTAAIAGGGSLLSGLGGLANNRAATRNYIAESKGRIENMRQDSEEAILRNKILGDYVGRQKSFVGQNQGTLAGVTGQFTAPAQDAALATAGQNRATAVSNAIDGTPRPEVSTRASASPMVQGEIAKRVGAAMDFSRAKGAAGAKVAAYGDTWGVNNNEALQSSARKIDTTNNFARGDIATLGADQDLQAFQQRKPVFVRTTNPNPGATMQGLGSLIGSFAGAYGGGIWDRTDDKGNIIPGLGGSVNASATPGYANVTSGYANQFARWLRG